MRSLLESSDIQKQIYRIAVEDYQAFGAAGFLNEDVELLQGLIVRETPKSPLHEYLSQVLRDLLISHVPPGFVVRQESPLTFSDSEAEPDISVVAGKPADWLAEHPHTAALVAEIAITSVAVDEKKAGIYAEAGIPEYWIIRPEAREWDVYRDPGAEGYRTRVTLRDGDTLRAVALPGIEFAVSDVFPPQG